MTSPLAHEVAGTSDWNGTKRMISSPNGLDSFDQYLQDVAKYPLIQDLREERELARRARAGGTRRPPSGS